MNWLRTNWLQTSIEALRWRRRLRELPLAQARLVVVDVETTGLDTERDELLAIGAVAVHGSAIHFSDQFDCTLQRGGDGPVGSILIHGITPSALAQGRAPQAALTEFLAFLGDSPALAFHAPFDRRILQRAIQRHLGRKLSTPFIDVAELAPLLLADVAPPTNTLDAWIGRLGLEAGARHHAAADALVTAELLLMLLQRARRKGLQTVGDLLAWARHTEQVRNARPTLAG